MAIQFQPVGPRSYPVHIYDFCCDQNHLLRPSYLLRWMQEYASAHAEEMGIGWEALMAEDMAFLLSRMTVRVIQMPKQNQDVTFTTWERGSKGVLYNREFSITGEDGEALVEATTQWMLVNPSTRQILRPNKVGFITPKQPFAAKVEDLGRLKLPEEMPLVGERPIRYEDVDYNGHLNNATYAGILCDYGGQDLSTRRITGLRLAFDHEALLGETMDIHALRQGEETLMEGKIGERVCFQGILATEPMNG